MLKIIYRNFEKSEFLNETAIEKIKALQARFPDLEKANILMTFSMENSHYQRGLDQFKVKFFCQSGRFKNFVMEKTSKNIYSALAVLEDHLSDKLAHACDKQRSQRHRKPA